VSNLGSPILAHTPHRALAGPYHRNVAGNLAVLDVLIGADEEARAAVSRAGAGLIAHCPGNPESAVLAEWAPGSLVDRLNRGEVPDWLIPLDGNDSLRLFTIRR